MNKTNFVFRILIILAICISFSACQSVVRVVDYVLLNSSSGTVHMYVDEEKAGLFNTVRSGKTRKCGERTLFVQRDVFGDPEDVAGRVYVHVQLKDGTVVTQSVAIYLKLTPAPKVWAEYDGVNLLLSSM